MQNEQRSKEVPFAILCISSIVRIAMELLLTKTCGASVLLRLRSVLLLYCVSTCRKRIVSADLVAVKLEGKQNFGKRESCVSVAVSYCIAKMKDF